MSLVEETANKVWIEITTSDEFTPCHHATFDLTDEIKRTVLKLGALVCEHVSELDYISVIRCYGVEFFEDDDSEEAIRTDGLTLHVDSLFFWFSTWIKNSPVRLETLPMLISNLNAQE